MGWRAPLLSVRNVVYLPLLGAIASGAACDAMPSEPSPAAIASMPTTPSAPPALVQSVTLTSTLSSGRVRRGDPVTFTAAATGGQPPIEFRFKGNGGILRGWNTAPSFTWDAATNADGVSVGVGHFYFWVEARSRSGNESERSSAVIEFTTYE